MRLIEDFWCRDPDGRRWTAPAGSIVNGATIPRLLWAIVGSPYTDDYRRASIVHDVACEDPSVHHEFKLLVAELANLPEDASIQEIDALIHKHFVP